MSELNSFLVRALVLGAVVVVAAAEEDEAPPPPPRVVMLLAWLAVLPAFFGVASAV
jgi:hypothetical protein